MTNNPLCPGTSAVRLLWAVLFLFCSGVFITTDAATGGMVLLTDQT